MNPQKRMLDPVVKSRLHEEIVRQIQIKIISGEFEIGQKLPPEREIAVNLNVNRATLREALKKLELLGLVEIRHGDGIYVRNYLESGNLELFRTMVYMDDVMSIDLLRNILDIRLILVPEMAARAALLRTDEELHELYTEVMLNTGDTILEKDLAVHHIIARASKNTLYTFLLNFFNQIFRDYGYLYFSDKKNQNRSQKFHRDLLAAMEKKQPEKARRITIDVLRYTEKQIYDYYENMVANPKNPSLRAGKGGAL